MSKLTGHEIARAGLADWALLNDRLRTRLKTNSFATGLLLVDRIGAAAESANHHPDLDLRYPHLDVTLSSHDVGGVTERDVALARQISDLAAAEGIAAAPGAVTLLEVALDTPDADVVRPFWRALLDMQEVGDDDVELRDAALPTLWFQRSGREEPRQRFHFDVWLDPELIEERIAAAVKAGGVLVSDAEAPSYWVLADGDGNRVCLCTWQDRDRPPAE